LKVGVSGQGTLMSFAGFGAIAASLTLASIPSKKRGATFLVSIMLMGLALIVFAFSTSLPLSLSMMILVGIGMTGNNTASAALVQVYTEPKFLGRVMSIMSVSFGLSSLGTFFASMLAESISPQWALGGLAISLAITSTVVFLFIPRIRKLD
jgi:MFS family permease